MPADGVVKGFDPFEDGGGQLVAGGPSAVVEALPKISSPSLVFASPQDHVFDPAATELWVPLG